MRPGVVSCPVRVGPFLSLLLFHLTYFNVGSLLGRPSACVSPFDKSSTAVLLIKLRSLKFRGVQKHELEAKLRKSSSKVADDPWSELFFRSQTSPFWRVTPQSRASFPGHGAFKRL